MSHKIRDQPCHEAMPDVIQSTPEGICIIQGQFTTLDRVIQ